MRLGQKFYDNKTLTIAQQLLGCVLVRRFRGRIISGIICETEAYIGPHDLASHASRGRTARTEVMFGPSGFWYVYLVYGMYHCLNIVTEKNEYPAAVLIRSIIPLNGIAKHTKTDGPGKLCKAFYIDTSLNNKKAFGGSPKLWIEKRNYRVIKNKIKKTPRVGIPYAGSYQSKPWRFIITKDAIQNAHRAFLR